MNDDDLFCYKFRAINKHMIESLVNPSLYFAKPSMLNDPFDCRFDLKIAFEQAASAETGYRREWLSMILKNEQFLENWNRVFDSIGVCSFSLYNNATLYETLLWSHYADEHKGICLLYQFPKNFIMDPKFNLTAGGVVNYLAAPLTNWLKVSPMEINSFVIDLIHIYLKTKSPAWAYEREVRIIRREHGIFHFHGGYLKQVCFGLQTPQADIDLVIKLARDYCGCTNFGQMVRDNSDFRFTMKPMGQVESSRL